MSQTLAWVLLLVYLGLMAASQGLAHRIVYPIVGWGHPLTGWRRGLVDLASPLILAVAAMAMTPLVLWAIYGRRR